MKQKGYKAEIRELLKKQYTEKFIPISNILNGINKRSLLKEIQPKDKESRKFDHLYNLLSNEALLVQSYGNIKTNKGSMTPGITNETIDEMSINKIKELSLEIKRNEFKFKPVKRIYIPKEKRYQPGEERKMRPLGIPTFKDRLVQEAIRMILETIYEPIFEHYNQNYGFRPKKSPHNAILKIKREGTGLMYAIEGDIKGAYDNVDHKILINILKKRISDNRFLKLIYQGCKAGLLDHGHRVDTLLGVPQGGLASPIIFNIYMHEFDEYIRIELQEYINQMNITQNRTLKPRNKNYDSLSTKIIRLRNKYKEFKSYKKWIELSKEEQDICLKFRKELKELSIQRIKLPSLIQSKREIKIKYIRYADDWIILTNSKQKIAHEIKNKIEKWLLENLKLELSKEKTKITNLKQKEAKFLGCSIRTYRTRRLTKNIKTGELQKLAGWNIIIDIDLKRILDRLYIRKFIDKKNKPIAKRPWAVLSEIEIVNRYNYIMRGLANYYFPIVDRLSHLNYIINYLLTYSCKGTFAKKFKSKITKINERFGNPIKITIREVERFKKGPHTDQPKTTERSITLLNYAKLKEDKDYTKYNWKYPNRIKEVNSDIFSPMESINWRSFRNLDSICAICGTTKDIQMHHIKHIKVGKVSGFTQVLKQLNRTMIPLCRTHHWEVHSGKYDNISLSELYGIERFLL